MNTSIIMIMAAQARRVTKQMDDPDEETADHHQLHELADACEDLMLAIRDRIGDSADAYVNASKGGP